MSSKILYDYGTDNTSVTGGFVFKGNYVSQATVLKNTDCMYMKNGNFGSYNFLMCETTNPIDLTDYTELKAELTCPTSNPSDYSRFGIGKEPITNNYGGVELVSDPIGKIGSKQIVTLDISNIDGFYYINLMADNGNEMVIHKVWLEGGSDIPDTPSRLAGTDAVAIAYAIARNQESAAALQEMKRAYREGVKRGNDGVTQDDNYVDEVIDDNGNTPIEPLVDPNNPDNVDKRGADMYYTIKSGTGEGETDETYYLRIYTSDATGTGSSEMGSYTYEWTYSLLYDLYNSKGEAISTENGISTYYTAFVVPQNVWYFKPTYIRPGYDMYNIYMYIEKVECSGRYITPHCVTIHATTGEVKRSAETTTVSNIPEGSTVVHTNSQKPF